MDFAGLLEDHSEKSQITVLRGDDVPTINVNGSGCRVRILSPPEDVGKLEIYELEFKTGDTLESQPHSKGTHEHLTVVSGQITVTSGDSSEMLFVGDTARYQADVPHSITGLTTSKAILVVMNT